jgi:probable HAF family extracellular repeat protein
MTNTLQRKFVGRIASVGRLAERHLAGYFQYSETSVIKRSIVQSYGLLPLVLLIPILLAAGCRLRDLPRPRPAVDPEQPTPTAMNGSGIIVGSIRAAVNALPAFVEREGVRRELPLPPNTKWAFPRGLNTSGQIVGFADDPYRQTQQAILWDERRVTRLNDAGAMSSDARAINDRGEIVGLRCTQPGVWRVCLWRNGALSEPAPLNTTGWYPSGINNRGDIAGWGTGSDNRPHLFAWQGDVFTDLGRGYQIGLNNRGQMAGDYEAADRRFHACVWRNGQRALLPELPDTLESHAIALNDREQIVGRVTRQNAAAGGGQTFPVLWQNGHAHDLNTLLPSGFPYLLEDAVAINNAGQILCIARPRQGIWGQGILLTPAQNHWQIKIL